MKKALFTIVFLASWNAMSYELSDLNGTWSAWKFGMHITYTISGLPSGNTKFNEAFTANLQATTAHFFKTNGTCEVTKIDDNKFESRCETGDGRTDHTYFSFIDQNKTEETDLQSGMGKIIARRKK